jgi:hypothetical protein
VVKSSQGASLFGSRGEVDGRGSGRLTGCEAGGWAWGCDGAGGVTPVGVSGAEGEEGVALSGVDGRVGGGLLGGGVGVLGGSAGWGLCGAGWTCAVAGKEPV